MFNVTPLAAQELHAALLRSDAAGMALRIAARADDDGSVQIGMGIDEAREEDATLQFGELTVLLGAPSRPLLDEAVLDYVEVEPGRFDFVILPALGEAEDRANASSGCGTGGCGSCSCG